MGESSSPDAGRVHQSVICMRQRLLGTRSPGARGGMGKMKKRLAVLAAAFCTIALVAGVAAAGVDFGQFVQRQLADQSSNLFGVSGPLPASSTKSPRAPRPPSSPAPTRVARPALGRNSFEGFAVYASGVTFFGDENRPAGGVAGGAYFKFIPASLRDPGAGPVTSLDQSPYATPGKLFGLRVGGSDFGQGTELGQGSWVPIPAAPDPDLRAQAAALHLTGYYRPEDIDVDRGAEANSLVRFCGNNTGNEGERLWGETVCISDGSLQQSAANTAVPEVRRFVQGSPAIAMPDNAAYQPDRGNWIIHEDASTNTALQGPHDKDLWDCLPDGADPDLQSDGCVRLATLNDLTAEWTGGIFDASGKHFYVSVQHNVSGAGTILDITGWQ